MSVPESVEEVSKNRLLWNMDAVAWAEDFIELFGNRRENIDRELMISWFANSIMTGYDVGYARGKRDGFNLQVEPMEAGSE